MNEWLTVDWNMLNKYYDRLCLIEDKLWLLYRDKYIPTTIPKIDNHIFKDLIAAMKVGDADNVREEVLKLIKQLRLNDADDIARIINISNLKYVRGYEQFYGKTMDETVYDDSIQLSMSDSG